MASLSIDDDGTLTTTSGGSDDVFYLDAPNGTAWEVTVAAADGAMTWIHDTDGTPKGRTEQSTSKWWEFRIANDGTLTWVEVRNPALVADFAASGEGCSAADAAAASEGCAAGVSAAAGESCELAASAAAGGC